MLLVFIFHNIFNVWQIALKNWNIFYNILLKCQKCIKKLKYIFWGLDRGCRDFFSNQVRTFQMNIYLAQNFFIASASILLFSWCAWCVLVCLVCLLYFVFGFGMLSNKNTLHKLPYVIHLGFYLCSWLWCANLLLFCVFFLWCFSFLFFAFWFFFFPFCFFFFCCFSLFAFVSYLIPLFLVCVGVLGVSFVFHFWLWYAI